MNAKTFNYIQKYGNFINTKNCIISKNDFMHLAFERWTIDNPNYLEFDNICWSTVEIVLNASVMVRLNTDEVFIQFNETFTKHDQVKI